MFKRTQEITEIAEALVKRAGYMINDTYSYGRDDIGYKKAFTGYGLEIIWMNYVKIKYDGKEVFDSVFATSRYCKYRDGIDAEWVKLLDELYQKIETFECVANLRDDWCKYVTRGRYANDLFIG